MKGIIVLILALVAFQSVKAEDLAPQNTACDACQYVVGLVENYIDANYTVDEITNFLEQWCSYVPQFGQMCDQIVQYGVQDFIAYIETNEAPDTFCKQVQLCNSVVLAEPTQGSNCAICEYVITLVENYVTSNTTIDEFVSVLDNYCSMVPGLAQVCDQLVQYGVDDLLAYIQADLSPQQVCTLAKLCTSEQKEVEVPAVTPTLGDNCSTCTFVVSLIETYVENNGTINQIIADVEKACSIIPGIQPICDQLVAAGIQQIINYINQDLSPTQICTLLKLCSSQAEAVPSTPVVAVAQVGDATCDTCQYVVTIIESYVEDNATVEEIEEKLQAACNVIPGIGPICQEFIDYGIQEIVNYINANLSPLQVCTLMKLCGNEVAVMAPSDSNCDLCKYVVGIVEEWLESNATIAQAVTRLDALCTYVPGFEAVCEQVVEMGVQEFVTYIQTNEQPETVCTQIGLCTSRTCGKKAPVMQTRVKTL